MTDVPMTSVDVPGLDDLDLTVPPAPTELKLDLDDGRAPMRPSGDDPVSADLVADADANTDRAQVLALSRPALPSILSNPIHP